MAQRRMISLRIANSSRFLQMPPSAQLLYLHLALRADDDGVVEAYPVMKLINSNPDDMHVLKAREFIRVLNDDLVCLVSHWQEHNVIRADRKTDSIYSDLLQQIPDFVPLKARPRSDVKTSQFLLDGPESVHGQRRLGKDRLGKVNINTPTVEEGFRLFWEQYPRKQAKSSAVKAWRKLDPGEYENVMKGLEAHKTSDQWQREGGRFIPHPATFINQRRWEDEIPQSTPGFAVFK